MTHSSLISQTTTGLKTHARKATWLQGEQKSLRNRTRPQQWVIQQTDSSDYSKHDRKFPSKASEWKIGHLLELGIHYDPSSTDLLTLMSNLKTNLRKSKPIGTDTDVSEFNQTLIQLSKDWWTFSFDFESAEKSLGGMGVVETLKQAEEAIDVFEQENYNIVESLQNTGQGDWKR